MKKYPLFTLLFTIGLLLTLGGAGCDNEIGEDGLSMINIPKCIGAVDLIVGQGITTTNFPAVNNDGTATLEEFKESLTDLGFDLEAEMTYTLQLRIVNFDDEECAELQRSYQGTFTLKSGTTELDFDDLT